MTSPTPTAARDARLDDRYGRTSTRSRRLWIVGLALVGVALLVYVAWGTLARTIDAVDYDTTGFHWHDEHSVTVDFQVTLRPDEAVACAVEAQDTDHGVVGWRVVSYPADPAHTRRFSVTVPTTAEATTGFVTSCWIP